MEQYPLWKDFVIYIGFIVETIWGIFFRLVLRIRSLRSASVLFVYAFLRLALSAGIHLVARMLTKGVGVFCTCVGVYVHVSSVCLHVRGCVHVNAELSSKNSVYKTVTSFFDYNRSEKLTSNTSKVHPKIKLPLKLLRET